MGFGRRASEASSTPRRQARELATLYRWATHGCRGVRLETIQIGGTKCTSQEALQRFFNRLSNPHQDSRVNEAVTSQSSSDSRRVRESEAVVKQLEQLGL